MKAVLLTAILMCLFAGCGLSHESHSRSEVKIYNPFYRDGGNGQSSVVGKKISSWTDKNMPEHWR